MDQVAHSSLFPYRSALARRRYRCVGGSVPALLGVLPSGWLAAPMTGRRLGILVVRQRPVAFTPVAELCLAREDSILLDRTCGLDDLAEALVHVEEGRALGTAVVEIR